MHSIIQGGLIPEGKESQKGQALSVFHSREPDVRESRSGRSSIRSGQTQNHGVQRYLEGSPKYSIFMLSQRKGLQFYQTRSHAIALFNTLPGICIEQVVYMKTGEDLYCKVHQSPRLPRVVPTPNLQRVRQDPSNLEARKSTDHQSEQSVKYRETCRGNVDYRIPGIPHSTVQKEDSNRKGIVKKLIQQFENQPK